MKTTTWATAKRFFLSFFTSALLLFPLPLWALDIVVEDTSDESPMVDNGTCTLREAISNAVNNSQDHLDCPGGPGEDLIDLTGLSGTIALASNPLDTISENMTITGPGPSVLSIAATGAFRIFSTSDSGVALNVSGLTLTGGAPATGGGGALFVFSSDTASLSNCTIFDNHPAAGLQGGGIKNSGELSIENCLISQNSTSGAVGNGGGIFNEGNLRIVNSAIIGNTAAAGNGGGIYMQEGDLVVVNSTFSGNSGENGGGIFMTNVAPSSTEIFSSTLTDNHATANEGGGISMSGGNPADITLTIQNTILAGNTGASEGPDCSSDDGAAAVITSLGYNLVGDDDECTDEFMATGDLVGSPANLGGLMINGGSTPTHAPLTGSPAINAGDPSGCEDENGDPLATDQRGFDREVGTACDIGAFEVGTCGDGGVDPGEGCDDGNTVSGDGCTSSCQIEIPPTPGATPGPTATPGPIPTPPPGLDGEGGCALVGGGDPTAFVAWFGLLLILAFRCRFKA